jgi:hypothetical protein
MPDQDPNAPVDPSPAPPAPEPPPSLAERAMATEDAHAAFVKARDKSDASQAQAQADALERAAALKALRKSIEELVAAAKKEDEQG